MEQKVILQLIGIFILLLGLLLSYNPELVSNKPIPEDIYRAVERRIWWGLLIGFGILLVFHHQLKPLPHTIAATGMSLTLGILIARFIGIFFDGSVPKQWMWVGVELLIFVALAYWYTRQLRL